MLIFPAIDLYAGKAVRLYKGNYDDMTVYSDDPLIPARDFVDSGASWVHIVDLEGARDGGNPNRKTVLDIKRNTGLKVEIGGGLRDMDAVSSYLDEGIDRVIIGTAAVLDPAFLESAVARYADRIAVGVDIRDGKVAIKGWKETSGMTFLELCRRLEDIGVGTIISTDISRDGAMEGTNRDLYRNLSEKFGIDLIASGGISTIDDIRALRDLGLYGAIVGKAYYTGAIDLKEAIKEAER